uniref:Uncharacterized protein n=1 Tax=Anguilla anguilla TaxID=7936 RepID=A0A0E9R180_ANGAN
MTHERHLQLQQGHSTLNQQFNDGSSPLCPLTWPQNLTNAEPETMTTH